MTTAPNEFDVAKAIVDHLKPLDEAMRIRVYRWVAESLAIPLQSSHGHPRLSDNRAGTSPPSVASSPSELEAQPESKTPDIRSFFSQKQPRTDIHFAAVVAYYFRFVAPLAERRESINSTLLQEATRLVDRERLAKPSQTLTNAKNQGFLNNTGRGEYSINSVGENLVAMTLPGTDTARSSTERAKPVRNKSPIKRKQSRKK
jgi:hypothetical protein